MTITPLELADWRERARCDDVLDHMVPSELRILVGEIVRQRQQMEAIMEAAEHRDVDACHEIARKASLGLT